MADQPTRARILAAAVNLFAERGFSGTSIAEVEAAAGLSPRSGALYKHFPSKLALLEAALEERMAEIDAFKAQVDLAPLGDLRAELTLAARWGLAELRRERDLVRIVMREGDRVPELPRRFREAIVEPGLDLATRIVERDAARSGASVADPRAVAEVMCASLVGYSLQGTLFGERFVDVDEERFVAAWVDSTATIVENFERSEVHA
jgi:AcrR family transcriptional regulator